MQYRPFGSTGAMVSVLGFGAMRLPHDEDAAVSLLREALDLGVNYIDTAPKYVDGLSEKFVGIALQGRRSQVYLSTKNAVENASGDDWRRRLEASLTKLNTDYIDFYHMWGINWSLYTSRIAQPNGPLTAARRAQEEGLIKHLSFSFHDKPENMIKLIDTGEFETVLCQYNLLDRANEAAIAYAKQKGLGVAIMGPIGGGRLAAPSSAISGMLGDAKASTPEVALRFVLANPNVSVALSGMSTSAMVRENARIAAMTEPLTAVEKAAIEQSLQRLSALAQLYCTGCNYCLPCPNGVQIPRIFELMNLRRVWGLANEAQLGYRRLMRKGGAADACVQCGSCEEKCPQKIQIIEQLKECAAALAVS